ncbi:hypothetical protein [Paenibacillus silviterrae]|uniref:hypothetical protein n=1 Tax=Paenibacillus silviterrae TaxID=3242194 RepID=UPI002542FFBE|nr:hypothetical protein [Paenibacillus chinjuensis]
MSAGTVLGLSIQYLILWLSVFLFSFTLFRFKLRDNVSRIAVSVLIMTQVSLLLQLQTFTQALVPIGQPIALVCTLVFIFRIPWLYAMMMTVVPYSMLSVAEFLSNYIMLEYSLKKVMDRLNQTPGVPEFAVLIVLMNMLTFLIYKSNVGFTFISRRFQRKSHDDLRVVVFAIVGLLLAAGVGLLYPWLFLMGSIGALAITGYLIYLSYHKEIMEN